MKRSIKLPRFSYGQTKVRPGQRYEAKKTSDRSDTAVLPKSIFEQVFKRKDRQKTQPTPKTQKKLSPQIRVDTDVVRTPSPRNNGPQQKPQILAAKSAQFRSTPNRETSSPSKYLQKMQEMKQRIIDYEKDYRAKLEYVKQLERRDEQRQIEYDNELRKLNMEKKRAQESLVKKGIDMQNLKSRLAQSQSEIQAAKQKITEQYQSQLNDLKAQNRRLVKQVELLQLESNSATEQLKRLTAHFKQREIDAMQANALEEVLIEKVSGLAGTIRNYSEIVQVVDRNSKMRLEDRERQVQGLSQQVHELKKYKSSESFHPDSQLRKTTIKLRSSQDMMIQLRSSNGSLSRKNKQLDSQVIDLNKKLKVTHFKYMSLQIQNKKLKERLLQTQKRHIHQIQRHKQDNDKMKESIEKINERVEKCIVKPGSQVSPRQKYLTDLVDKYKQDVQELTKKLAYAQGMIGSTGMKLYGSEQPTLDREQSIKGMIEKDISSLVREG